VIVQTGLHNRWELRERGRRGFQRLVDRGRQEYAAAKDHADYSRIHESLVKAAARIEAEQGEGFFAHMRAASEREKDDERPG